MYAIVDWEGENTSSVVTLSAIIAPRKEFDLYEVGDAVSARFQGKVYPAVIMAISDDRKELGKQIVTGTTVSQPKKRAKTSTQGKDENKGKNNSTQKKNKRSEISRAAPKKQPTDKEVNAKKDAENIEQRKRERILQEISSFRNSSVDFSSDEEEPISPPPPPPPMQQRPTVGMKAPKPIWQTAACVSCVKKANDIDDLQCLLNAKDDTIKRLQQKIEQLSKEIKKMSAKSTAETNANKDEEKVEMVPGSGLYITPNLLREADAKPSPTGRARFLLSCVISHHDIVRAGSVKEINKNIIKSVALYASKDQPSLFTKCKLAVRHKVTAILSRHRPEEPKSSAKSREYISSSEESFSDSY